MKNEIFELAIHRPLPHILVGFTATEHEKAKSAMINARLFMIKLITGSDGLTEADRSNIDLARQIVYDWRAIARLANHAHTVRAKDILRQEIIRAYDNEYRRRKNVDDR